jgi:hypothetical protein
MRITLMPTIATAIDPWWGHNRKNKRLNGVWLTRNVKNLL